MRREHPRPLRQRHTLRQSPLTRRPRLALGTLIVEPKPRAADETLRPSESDERIEWSPAAVDGVGHITQQILVVHFALRTQGPRALVLNADTEPLPAALAVAIVQIGDTPSQRAMLH